ncbi:T9SS type A sorting domain-containing protein [Spirosoma fluviale]|uniref:Por secretion system C-terminal sorting domain-containing protein n=1 Tax=Spirosoma fluviale TaxID=1597977 RepID=A0A286F956_9BACT|nr:T9SS type A sorting domain-containing protein [Spirosoma fluviale]SOD79755.1 Por secretion system C-terminal sorting domain-containing protein [Spirosoma fluviale]
MDVRLRIRCQYYFRFLLTGLICLGLFSELTLSAWATETTPTQAPTVLTISVSSATVCSGASTTLTAAGCPTGGVVQWSTTATGSSIVVAPVQTASYTAICAETSPAATTTTATATVQVYPPIKISPVASLSVLCNGGKDGQVAINASGGTGVLQYQFNGQPFQSVNSTFGNLAAGIYTVAVKDALGCQVQGTVEVKQPPALSATTSTISPSCLGRADGSFTAFASGGVGDYRFLLNGSAPQVSGTFINLRADTTYSLIVADKNNCVLFRDVVISPPASFTIKLTSTSTRCPGSADGIVLVSATGGAGNYQYRIGTGPLQTGSQFTGLAASSYEVTVVDGFSCEGKQTVIVGQPTPLQLTLTAVPVSCQGPNSGAIRITPTGGTGAVKYQISTGSALQSSPVFTGIGVGDYTIVGVDANGCTSLASVTVGKADPLKIQVVPIAATCCVCATGGFRLSTAGGIGTARQYQIIGQPYQSASTLTGLRPNTYRLRVVDEAGCTDTTAAVVTNGNALTLSVGRLKDVTCAGGNDGEAAVQVAGGTKPFTYYWATERRDTLRPFVATQTGLVAGTYTVSVVDSNRCSSTTLFVPLKAQFTIPVKPTISMTGSSTLVADQSAGVQWFIRLGNDPAKPVPDATGSTLIPFQSGQYYAIVTTNGCSSAPSDPINFILTALSEPVSSLAVRVLPNPVVDRLRLEIEQLERSAVTIQLLDASGRAVMMGQLPAFTGKKQAEWPLTGVMSGNYLLKVNADKRQSVLRVVVE